MNSADVSDARGPLIVAKTHDRRRRSLKRSLVACLVATQIASCAVVDPVRPAAYDTFFSRGRAADIAAKAGTQPRRDLDQVQDVEGGSVAARAGCARGDLGPSCFAGGLGLAIDDVDERRIQLVHLAKQVSNGNAAYDALLYPLGGAVVYRALRGGSQRSLLLPAVAAASLYGFMNAGVVDRDRHYLRTAGELHCAIVRHGSWLYPEAEIQLPNTPNGSPSLDGVIVRLHRATHVFAQQRAELVYSLRAKPGVASRPMNAIDQRVAQARGDGRGGAAGGDSRREIELRTQGQLGYSQRVLADLRDLRAQIESSGQRLRLEWTDIEQESQRLLSEKVPPPAPLDQKTRELFSSTQDLVAQVQAQVRAHAQGERVDEVPNTDQLDPMFPVSLRNGVSLDSQQVLRDFSRGPGVELSLARDEAKGWLDGHAQRQVRATAEIQRLGCTNRLPPSAPRGGSTATREAQKPPTSVTPSAGGNSSSQGSSTRLPRAP